MYKVVEFSHNVNDEEYKVIVEYVDIKSVTSDPYKASCPTDLTGERWINDVVILDRAENDVTENITLTDNQIWDYIDSLMEEDVILEQGMTYFDIFTEAEEYYDYP